MGMGLFPILSEYMSTQGRFDFNFEGKTVLELGAGTGLPGLTAAKLGASLVILTDVEPLLAGLVRNVEENGLQNRVAVSKLVWGSDELPSRIGGLGEVDLVLMSDVFFGASETVALADTLKRVCGKGTRVWAASELRPWTTNECVNELISEGFGVVELSSQLGNGFASAGKDDSFDVFSVFQLVLPNQDKDRLEEE
ncbi:unnamed protein product [Ilex paraguariensis]|uniref:Uncharacterized protein n=1 Tax=Ilex paraguariensis TaxID=185542 RepID=A0ABC8TT15_9AQUA